MFRAIQRKFPAITTVNELASVQGAYADLLGKGIGPEDPSFVESLGDYGSIELGKDLLDDLPLAKWGKMYENAKSTLGPIFKTLAFMGCVAGTIAALTNADKLDPGSVAEMVGMCLEYTLKTMETVASTRLGAWISKSICSDEGYGKIISTWFKNGEAFAVEADSLLARYRTKMNGAVKRRTHTFFFARRFFTQNVAKFLVSRLGKLMRGTKNGRVRCRSLTRPIARRTSTIDHCCWRLHQEPGGCRQGWILLRQSVRRSQPGSRRHRHVRCVCRHRCGWSYRGHRVGDGGRLLRADRNRLETNNALGLSQADSLLWRSSCGPHRRCGLDRIHVYSFKAASSGRPSGRLCRRRPQTRRFHQKLVYPSTEYLRACTSCFLDIILLLKVIFPSLLFLLGNLVELCNLISAKFVLPPVHSDFTYKHPIHITLTAVTRSMPVVCSLA